VILTGIADEAGQEISAQIRAHQQLGWKAIELRCVKTKNAAGALDNDEFLRTADALQQAGIEVTCFASAIGNWSRHLLKHDFAVDVNELKSAIKRMSLLGTKFIRTMSWVGTDVDDLSWRDETVRRYHELVKIAEDNNVFIAHENCTGWGGLSPANMRYLHDQINSKNFVLLFDTGNTVSHGQDPWDFYMGIKDLIRYVHIKDCCRNHAGGISNDFQFVGEGDAMVKEILADLYTSGYRGVVSIEPHVGAIVHAGVAADGQKDFDLYIKYGNMLKAIVSQIKGEN
jgi:sugar phosphate isomerase/epimerase